MNLSVNYDIPALSLDEKIDFFMEFYAYIKSSFPITTALTKIAKNSKKSKIKNISNQILNLIDSGKDFPNIITKFSNYLGSINCNLLAAGAKSGELPKITQDILTILKKQRTIRRNIIKSSIYPAILFFIFCVVISWFFVITIPKVITQVEYLAGDLTLSLKILKNISKYWFIILALFLFSNFVLIMLFIKFLNTRHAIKFPIIGKFIKMANLSMFTKVFSISYAAGIPVVSAFLLSCESVSNKIIKNKLLRSSAILSKKQVSDTLCTTELFEQDMISKIESGEMTGNLDSILNEISIDLDEQLETMVESTMKALEPILVLIIGIFVLILVYIMYGPGNPLKYI